MVATRSAGRPLARFNDAIDRMRRARRWVKRYKPTDWSRRHRIADGQRKDVQVQAYTRRA